MTLHRVSRVLIKQLPIVLIIAIMAVAVSGSVRPAGAAHDDWPAEGVICTTNPSSTFTLIAQDGFVTAPDGNAVYMWGFSESGQPFQHPGPVLCVNQGDEVTVVVENTLQADISLVFPGQVNVLANGQVSQPVFDGAGEMVSLAPVATANGGMMTYSFIAGEPGTYLYQSGTESLVQVNMGLFGGIIVRPTGAGFEYAPEMGQAFAYNHPGSRYNPDTEYLMIFSEIDPVMHMAVEQGLPYDVNDYAPRYWMINGRSFPDTIAPNGATWMPNQPYGSLVHIQPFNNDPAAGPAYNPDEALIRYIGLGSQAYPHHPHGNHERVIARDGKLLVGAGGEDLTYEKFTVILGPGQTMDALFHWEDVEGWNPIDNPVPVTIPQLQNLTFGTFYSGSPYLGYVDMLPVGTQALNECGEYYHIAHNHGLHQITAWGVVLSGHITFSRIDPPLPNTCQ